MPEPGFGAPSQPLLPVKPDVERYAQFKQQQAAFLQQHQQVAAQLQDKQAKVAARGADLDIAGRLYKILDNRVTKSARQFLTKELAQHVGADPKSQQFKDVSTMLGGLDPDTMQQLRSSFGANLESMQPGEIAQTVRGIMTGEVPMNDFLDKVGPATYQTQQTSGTGDVSGAGGSETLTGGTSTANKGTPDTLATTPAPDAALNTEKSQARAGQDQPGAVDTAVAPAPFQPGAPGAIQSFEGQRTVPSAAQQASPTIVGALGLDSRERLRNNDLIQNGYRIPFDPKEQDKLAETINTRSSGLSATVSEAVNLVDAFEGKPEVLGPVGSAVRTLQSTIQQVQGLLNVINPLVKDETLPDSPDLQRLTRQVGTQLAKTHAIDNTAETAAQIDARVLGLAYRMAIANDIPGNRLTNAILEQNLRMIGSSSSPTQFKAVLSNTLASTTREYDEAIKRTLGTSGLDIMSRQVSNDDIARMAKHADILPPDLAKSLLAEAQRRKTGDATPAIKPASPTLNEEEATLGTLETQSKGRAIAKQDQTMQLEQSREERAIRTEGRANDREDRVAAAQTASAKLQSEEFAYRKAHDQAQMDQHDRDKIVQAFQHFGAAIASSGGSSSISAGSSGSPGQDVSAFRITPPPQRTPPRPGGR